MKRLINVLLVVVMFVTLISLPVKAKGYRVAVANSKEICDQGMANSGYYACYVNDLQQAYTDTLNYADSETANVTLLSDIELSKTVTLSTNLGRQMFVGLNMEGYTISASDSFEGDSLFEIKNVTFVVGTYGVFEKQSTINSGSVDYIFEVSGGSLNINNGKYIGNKGVVNNISGSTYIGGGDYSSSTNGIITGDRVTIAGGSFYKFDPREYASGLSVTSSNDTYYVNRHTVNIEITGKGSGTIVFADGTRATSSTTKEVNGLEYVQYNVIPDSGSVLYSIQTDGGLEHVFKVDIETKHASGINDNLTIKFEKKESSNISIGDPEVTDKTKELDPTFELNGQVMDVPFTLEDLFNVDQKEEMKEGASGLVYLSVKEINDTPISVINTANGKTIGMCLDINLYTKVGDDEPIKVKKVTDSEGNDAHVVVLLKLPDSLINSNSARTRKYSIVRVHDGVSETLKAYYNEYDETLRFETDRFSTYAVVYEDVDNSSNTSNKDNNTSSTQGHAVTCEEYMNDNNWTWSEKTKTCVYRVANTSSK